MQESASGNVKDSCMVARRTYLLVSFAVLSRLMPGF